MRKETEMSDDDYYETVELENKICELRQLNAELLGHIKGVIPILESNGYKATAYILKRQINKAEKLK
jgi:hypothetical protein